MQFFNSHTHFSFHPHFEILQREIGLPCNKYHSSGVHPWNAEHYNSKSIEDLNQLFDHKQLVAIGEIGLDKLKGPNFLIQESLFNTQIELAEKLKLPVIIHCVKAWNETKQIKRSVRPTQKWIYHGFAQSGITDDVINEGLMISLGSAILHHPKNQSIIQSIPNERLLIETDDKEIEIIEIYRSIAELKKISLQELVTIVEQNFKNTFQKWHIG